jgi:hypothetical protein
MTTALEGGEGSASRPGCSLPPGKDPVRIVQKAGWAPGPVWKGAENLSPTGIRSPNRRARSQSLYRLSYLAHILFRRLAKFRRATTSFVMSVRPRGTSRLPLDGISWNSICEFFSKIVEQYQVSLKSDKSDGYFTSRLMYIYDYVSPSPS